MQKNWFKRIAAIMLMGASVLLTGCASIVSGSNQTISVMTTPRSGAHCTIANTKGRWYVPETPGSVVVHRAYGDLFVTCKKGHRKGFVRVKSATKGMAFGNVFFVGLIGSGVDTADVATAYDYPQQITVPLRRKG